MDIMNFLMEHIDIFIIVIAAIALLVGSFLNVVIYRLPRMIQNEWSQECREYLGLKSQPTDNEPLNLCLPLSHCTQCKTRLKPWHNIPVLSYLILRGKCAYCKATMSMRYPLVELLCCITSAYVAWRFGFSWQTVGGLVFTWILIALTFIDLDYQLLPDSLTLFLLWVGLFLSLFGIFVDSHNAILGAMIGYLIFAITQWFFQFFTGKSGMGQGDFKFLAALGACLGWAQLPIIILLASVIGMFFGIMHMIVKRQFKSTPLPFGPYLAIAGWTCLIWGNDILRLYLTKFMM
jgi:leader peptidase (prepilin peptidase)/N-methyltransferase